MKIQVKEEDINGATQRSPTNCVVARAITRTLKEAGIKNPWVSSGNYSVGIGIPTSTDMHYRRPAYPHPVQSYIQAYDATGVANPMEFELDYENPSNS